MGVEKEVVIQDGERIITLKGYELKEVEQFLKNKECTPTNFPPTWPCAPFPWDKMDIIYKVIC